MVSFPPLIDMLKFSGYSYLIRGQPEENRGVDRGGRPRSMRATKSSLHRGSNTTPVIIFRTCRVLQRQESNDKPCLMVDNDARTGMPFGMPKGAICVQRFDDSLNSAIRITYRISLRSSSMPEPRDPLLKVLTILISTQTTQLYKSF